MQDLRELGAEKSPTFMKVTLIAAGLYNLIWGAAVILFPLAAFQLVGMQPPRYPQIWQCVGMIVGVYGLGYWIASRDPFRHWPIVFVGLAGKVLGPVGFLFAAASGEFPWTWGTIIVFNDLIWWVPFVAILYQVSKRNSDTSIGEPHDLDDATLIFASEQGRSLVELSKERPLMVVFLRHFGCTFCREALADLAESRKQLDDAGVSLALVHMSGGDKAAAVMNKYGLEGVHHFSDPNCEIYRAFGIDRGSATQLFGWKTWWRGALATLRGRILGAIQGDAFRMPGLFFLHRGEICVSFRHRRAADRPDYVKLARDLRKLLYREECNWDSAQGI